MSGSSSSQKMVTIELKAPIDLLKELQKRGVVHLRHCRGKVPKNPHKNQKVGKVLYKTMVSEFDGGQRQWGTIEFEIPRELYRQACDIIYVDKSRQEDKLRQLLNDWLNNGMPIKEERRVEM